CSLATLHSRHTPNYRSARPRPHETQLSSVPSLRSMDNCPPATANRRYRARRHAPFPFRAARFSPLPDNRWNKSPPPPRANATAEAHPATFVLRAFYSKNLHPAYPHFRANLRNFTPWKLPQAPVKKISSVFSCPPIRDGSISPLSRSKRSSPTTPGANKRQPPAASR